MQQPSYIDIKPILKQEMKRSGLSRAQIADRMNKVQKKVWVTENMLNKWTAKSQEKYLPAYLMPAFCHAVGSVELPRILAASLGVDIISLESYDIVQSANKCPFCFGEDLNTDPECTVVICKNCKAQAPVDVWLSAKSDRT